ncbi:MAG: Wzz/FepE/Etk N-terminal domain-containing protein [candidate division WOR-3 bacterium]
METLLKYLGILVRYRKLIFYDVLIFTILAIIISFLLPPKYQATAQILPPSEESEFAGVLGAGGLSIPKLSRLARGGSLLPGATPSDLIAAILGSRTIQERVIIKCDLMKVYKIKKSMELAVRTLSQATKIRVSEEGVVTIVVEAPKPKLAADIANSYIEELDRFLKESNMSRGKNMRLFIEKRLTSALNELKTAQESLRVFQERHRVVALDEETKAVIDAYASLKAELLKREMELGIVQNVSTPDNFYLAGIKREIAEFRRQLAEIETGKRGKGYGAGFAVPFANLPAVAAEYARRLRDYRVQEEIYALLIQQYEQAKILEARDTPTITVLDYARIPERRSFPKRRIIVLFAFLLSFLGGVLLAFGLEYGKNLPRDSFAYQEWVKIKEITKNDLPLIKNFFSPKEKKGRG